MKKFLQHNWIVLTISIATIASVLMAMRNKSTIDRNSALQDQSAMVKRLTKEILSETVHGLDLGLRGYAISKEEKMLIPYRKAIEQNQQTFAQLKSLLEIQQYPRVAELELVQKEVATYIALCDAMIEQVKHDTTVNKMRDMLHEDPGYTVWKRYDDFARPLNAFEDTIYAQAQANYDGAIFNNLVLQICIALLILPALFLFMKHLGRERKARQSLLLEVEQNDRKFVFDPGTKQLTDAQEVIETTIRNSQEASNFIKSMANGNYDVEWNGLTDENNKLNRNTIAGHLREMREKLKQVKREDEQRNWSNEGLATFSEIVRNNQGNSKTLADQCVSYLTKYVHAQQCSLFTLEGEEYAQYLSLIACYAFDRKKWLEKKVEIGSGLLGQAFLEKEIVQLTTLPEGYTHITSGLGQASPRHLLIVPVKNDVQIIGLIEMASFSFFEDHQIVFLKRAAEFLASAIISTQTTQKMKYLLEQAQINEETMRQREEELRQNMEELQATQEEMIRKEKEMQERLSSVSSPG